MERIRVVIVGKTGHGKSSLIAYLTGKTVEISDSSCVCTLRCSIYSVEYNGKIIDFIDTPGFEEADSGNISSEEVLQMLLNALETDKHGWDQLIYVKSATEKVICTDGDYVDLCCNFVCSKAIPSILVLTHSDKLDQYNSVPDIVQNKWLHQSGEGNYDAYRLMIDKGPFQNVEQVAFPLGDTEIVQKYTESSKAKLLTLIHSIGRTDRLHSLINIVSAIQNNSEKMLDNQKGIWNVFPIYSLTKHARLFILKNAATYVSHNTSKAKLKSMQLGLFKNFKGLDLKMVQKTGMNSTITKKIEEKYYGDWQGLLVGFRFLLLLHLFFLNGVPNRVSQMLVIKYIYISLEYYLYTLNQVFKSES